MSMRECGFAAVLATLALGAGAAYAADTPGLGQPVAEADVQPWDISILPDGSNLPPGSGTAAAGSKIFAEKCAMCHGENGTGANAAALVGSPPLDRIDANKTIANFWGYSTTVFDYIRRAMPWPTPRTLGNDEVYALTAFILAQNKIIGETDIMNAQSLPKVRMPNRDNFIIRFPDKI